VRVPRRFEAIVFVTASAQDVSVGSRDGLPGLVHDNDQPPRCISSGEGQDHEIGGVTGTYNLYEYVEQKRYVAYAIENHVREALGMKSIAMTPRPLA
jgi:hypothetical protein